MEKDDFNLIDRFLYKLLICSAFLFAIVFLDQVKVVKLEKVRQPFAEHINILPFIQKLNGKESFLLPVDITDQVSAPTYQVYQNSQVIKNGRLIVLDDYQGSRIIKRE